jgi:TRAP-type C4-dicarboxylate transport system permease small subunit
MKKIIQSTADLLDRMTRAAVTVLLGALVVVISLEVLFRYVLTIPMVWSEQLASYIMIWLAYLSAAIAFRQGAHMGMTILSSRLPEKAAGLVGGASRILVMGFLIMLAYWGFRHALDVRSQISPVVFNMSMIWPYMAVPAGSVLMLVQAVNLICNGQEENTDVAGDIPVSE